jgi:hypothetical protein
MYVRWKDGIGKWSAFWTNENIILVLFVCLLSFQLPISGGPKIIYSCVELFILVIAALFGFGIFPCKKDVQDIFIKDHMTWILIAWSVWSVVVWFADSNWAYGINETRWVLLSVVAYIYFRIIFRQQWEWKVKLFLIVCVGIAFIADLQSITGLFQPPFTSVPVKDFFQQSGKGDFTPFSVAVGFFNHPNAFGGFVFWPMLLSLGLMGEKKTRVWGGFAFLFFGFSLFLSGYRTLLLGAGLAVVLFILLRFNLSFKKWAFLLLGVCVVSAIGFMGFYLANKTSLFFGTFTGRVSLWSSVVPIVTFSPQTFLFGSGTNLPMGIYNGLAVADPHNAYLYMLVHYGLPGLIIYFAVIGIIMRHGWQSYRVGEVQKNPIVGVLWIGFIVWFLTAIADSRLTTPEWQLEFVLLIALFLASPRGEAVKNSFNNE